MKLKHFSLAFLFAALFTAPVVANEEDTTTTEQNSDEACSTCKKATCDTCDNAEESATEEAGE